MELVQYFDCETSLFLEFEQELKPWKNWTKVQIHLGKEVEC